ncbi:MAG TPA: DNA ligase D [Phycisphaerales bacterium]|nr:DNA ligase D [Phycisphaerales bacterium]
MDRRAKGGPDGVTSFQALQNRLKKGGTGLAYQVFDLPYFAGYDLRGCTLEDRRAVLRTLVRDASQTSSPVRFSEAIKGNGDGVFQNACKLGLEGIVSKRLGSTYVGQRTRDWVKTKCTSRQEMVIGGYTDPQRTRTAFGALLLGYYRENEFVYAGKVGTGFDERTLKDVLARLRPLERPDAPFAHPPRGYEAKGAHWVSPKLVCEVEFTEWTGDGHLRHPSFAGLREDKDAREVVREHSRRTPRAEENSEMDRTPHKGRRARRSAAEEPDRPDARAARSRRSRPSPSGGDEEARVLGVQLTHPDKVLYPESGITKRALAEYYAAIGDRMLPSIAGRPLMLVRCPEGRRATCFHQKNWDVELGPGSHGLIIKEQTTSNRYIIVDKPAGLVWLVQRGVLEIHDWGSTEKDLEHPDRLVFDLDPGPGVEWPEVVEGAVLVRDTLEEIGLKSWVKTTGGKGLHVVAPLRPKADWAHVKQFAMALAQAIAQKQPDKYVANMSKARRNGKIYVDYLRNARGATSVAAYSTRSRPGSPVSVPLSWKELAATKARPSFGLREVVARARKPDPWADMKKIRQSLKG